MNTVFDAYAAYYDLFNSEKDYSAEAHYVARLIRRHASEAAQLLEFGCGTGGHAIHLVNSGFSVTGLDSSSGMIAAAERLRLRSGADAAERLSFLQGDARKVTLERRFDAVVALFHVMSYQTADLDVVALLDAAARHLESGGLFVFDYWYGPAVLAQGPGVRVKRLSANGINAERLAEPKLVPAENRVEVTYTFRIDTDPKERPIEFSERHDMRYFFPIELRRFAADRFDTLESCAWMTDRVPGIDDWSAVTVLRRR